MTSKTNSSYTILFTTVTEKNVKGHVYVSGINQFIICILTYQINKPNAIKVLACSNPGIWTLLKEAEISFRF